jgi:hypothetical protein
MIEDDFFAIIDPLLRPTGLIAEDGEEYRDPPLDVLRYYRRPVRLHWIPWFGRALSVVAVVRQPLDIGLSVDDYRRFLTRLAMAVNGRFPPWQKQGPRGLVIGLTTLVLTPEPIGPEDDGILSQVLGSLGRTRTRAVPFGIIRVNLGQEAISFALASSDDQLFPEPLLLADALTERLRRFVPLMDL